MKNSDTIRKKDLRGLKSFTEDYPEVSPLFIYRGSEQLKIDDIFCIPADQFLLNLTPDSDLLTNK